MYREGDPPLVPPERSRLADVAYLLACIGPLSFVVYALDRAFRYSGSPLHPDSAVMTGLLLAASPVGLALGLIGIWKIPLYMIGRERARAAVVIGILSCGSIVVCGPELIQMASSPEHGNPRSCIGNAKQISLGLLMYAQDFDDRFPIGATWSSSLLEYVKNREVFVCPTVADKSQPTYALNRRLEMTNTNWVKDPFNAILVFESIPGGNRAGGKELLPDPPRHDDGHTVGFVDGHVSHMAVTAVPNFLWRPTISKPPDKPKRTK